MTKNNHNIKLIAFDLGLTLVYNAREEYYIKYLKKHNIEISRQEIDLAFHYADKTFMRHYIGVLGRPPQYFLPWYLGIVNYRLGQLFDLNEQSKFIMDHTDMTTYWKLFDWSKDVLKSLIEKGYEVALLSNWDLSCRELIKNLGIFDLFDYVIISSEIGIEKPDERIFKRLMEKSGYKANEILYVGDNYYDDVEGSRKVGIETVLINRFGNAGIEEINDCQVIQSTKDLLPLLENAEAMSKIYS